PPLTLVSNQPLEKPPDPPLSWSKRVSRERKQYHAPLAKDALWKTGKIKISYPDGDDFIPHSAWNLGRLVSYSIMERRVRKMWNLKMTLMDLPNHYFVARFELEDNFLHVLMEGP
ncbi:hypothetical protein V2J09_010912, partial [Rumex salicifolius]